MDTLAMITALSNACGPSGFEDDVLAAARMHAPEGLVITEDSLRNLYLRRAADINRGEGRARPVVLLDAHSDEVGFMVQCVKPDGTLQFIPLGGIPASSIPAHRVRVRNGDGAWIPGVTAAKPPHFMTESEKNRLPEVADMAIDIGASTPEEVRSAYRVRVGAPCVPDVALEYIPRHDTLIGKAFDCRLGCAAVLRTLHDLGDERLPVDVVGALSAQEEVGTRGAAVTARTVRPDIAIVFEGCPADDTVAPAHAVQTALRKGPMLRHIDARMITNPRFQRLALDIAEELGIPVQEAVRTGGSTNGAPIHLSNAGVPCIVMGLPVRYIHSHYGMASMADFEQAVRLAVAIVRRLDRSAIAGM